MRDLEYREDVDYVMGRYGEKIREVLEEQKKHVCVIKRTYFINSEQYRDSFIKAIKIISEKFGLNVDFAELIGLYYIREREFLGNEVEVILGHFKRKFDIGDYCYDALTAKDINYRRHLKRRIIDGIECDLEDKQRLEKVIDLFIDGIISIKLSISKEGVKEKDFLTQEAQLVKLCESVCTVYELLTGIENGSISEFHNWYEEMLIDIGISKEVRKNFFEKGFSYLNYDLLTRTFYNKICNDIIETSENSGRISMSDTLYKFINQMRGIVDKSYKKEEINQYVKDKIATIRRIIDAYATFLSDDNNYYIEELINNSQKSEKILESFRLSESYELLAFVSYYTPEEYEDIKKHLDEIRNREWDEIKNLCKGKDFKQAMQCFKSKMEDSRISEYRYNKIKNYLDIYLTYGRPVKMPEYLKKDKSIAYEFAIRFLSTKTPEQLLEIVKKWEEYEKSFVNSNDKNSARE